MTAANLLRGAWQLVLAQETESSDVVYGLTQNGRMVPVPGVEGMVGPTMVTVPVRAQVNQLASVGDYLSQTQRGAALVLPFEQVGLQNIKRLSTQCRKGTEFNSLLVIQAGGDAGSESDLGLTLLDTNMKGFLTYALVLECSNSPGASGGPGHIDIAVHYDPTVVKSRTVQRVARQLGHVTQQLSISAPEQRLTDLDHLCSHDRQLLQSWNSEYPESVDSCIPTLVKLQKARAPSATAVLSWDAAFSYAELIDVTNRLAVRLVAQGVKPGSYVPICFEKSSMAIVAMMAIMKAGAAFVPLDPSHPPARLCGLVQDVGASIVVLSAKAPPFDNVIAIEVTLGMLAELPAVDLSAAHTLPLPDPSRPAYVLFTSGSTGKPKGVVVPHSAICTSMSRHAVKMHMTSASRTFQFASYSFDASICEIFTTLISGGCVCVPSEEQRTGGDLATCMAEMGVTWAFFTPTLLRLISPDDVPSVKSIVVGGEAMTQDIVNVWSSKVQLLNGYGPTECCVFALTTAVAPGAAADRIGFPLGLVPWVVDPSNHDQLVPVGTVGELLLQGPTLARGYLNDGAKTESAFISAPRWCRDAEPARRRFYKTGDLVRFDQDGSVLYVGRKDAQAKLHGQRVEPAEIEHHLREADADKESVVIFPKTGPCAGRLVAIIITTGRNRTCPADNSAETSTTDLIHADKTTRAELAASVPLIRETMLTKLPQYMVPTSWFPLAALPQTTSGKVDRKKLVAWIESMQSIDSIELLQAAVRGSQAVVPTTEEEVMVSECLTKVLNLDKTRPSLDQSFVSLGGDSISAMQLASRCRAHGLQITVAQILRSNSITELAALAVRLAKGSRLVHSEDIDVPFAPVPGAAALYQQDISIR